MIAIDEKSAIIIAVFVNFVLLVVAYLIGSINISLIVSKLHYRDDIRKYGSGNAGATNMLRHFGIKIGFLVFWADVLKVYIFSLIIFGVNVAINSGNPFYTQLNLYDVFDIQNTIHPATLFPQIAALGIVIGHVFPIYFNFKGGKGAAALVGYLLTMNFIIFIIGAIIFLSLVALKKIVSFATISATALLVALVFVPYFARLPLGFTTIWALWYINGIVYLIVAGIVIAKHKANILRLMRHEEKTISASFKRKIA